VWGRKARARAEEERRRAEFVAQLVEARTADKPARPRFELTRNVLAAARRATFRARRVLAPFAVLAVIAAVGGWVEARQVPLPAVLALTAAAAGAWWRLRAHRLDRMQECRYAALCLALAAGWLVWVPIAGPAWSALVAGWAVAALPWWRHHWPRPRVDIPDVEPLGDVIVERWEDNVSPNVQAVRGATLNDPAPFQHGTEYRVQLRPGQQTVSAALAALDLISSGLITPMTRVVFEAHPAFLDLDPTQARLRVLHTSPVKSTVYFERPRCEDGRILLGPYADGVDDAGWRLYTQNSMWGGFLLGSSGYGKSRLIELLAISARHMSAHGQPTMLVYLDGQAGASSSLLWRHATLCGGPAEAEEILSALERVMVKRQMWNVHHGYDGFTPGRVPDGAAEGLVGILVILDEAHVTFGQGSAKRWARIAREGRKVGVVLLAASQYNDLDVFGGEDPLRSSLLAGNGLALHTASEQAGNLIPGLLIDPTKLPAIPGFGYKIAAQGSGERTAPFRASYLPKVDDKTADPTITVPSAEEWFDRTSDAPLDTLSARAMGDLYERRAERAEQDRARVLAELNGTAPPPALAAAAAVSASTVTAGVTTASVVRDLLAERGPQKREDIVKHVEATLGTGLSAVKAALTKLQTDGDIERDDRHGVYQVAP
jgi:hypothetical protein